VLLAYDAKAPSRAPPNPDATHEPQPVIDSVTVEKSEVCFGEENLVTVRAHTVNATDDQLHYAVAGISGQAVPIVRFPQDEGEPEKHSVAVFGRNNVMTTVPVPNYRVKDCGKRPLVLIEYRGRANRPDEFELSAKVLGLTAGDIIASYEWDFGDAQQTSTNQSMVLHSYRNRVQKSAYAQYLVNLQVVTKTGHRHLGRVALQLLNRAYQTRLSRGVVILESDYEPRFAVMEPDGKVHQRVRLFHHEAEPVTIDAVYVEKQFVGTGSATKLEPIAPESVLPGRTVPPGDGLHFELTLDTESEPDTFGLNYVVSGRFATFQVQGAFSLLRPPRLPTKEENVPVLEPAFRAKVLAARRLLHKDYVTDEEIHDLEAKGVFKGDEFKPTTEELEQSGPPLGAVPPSREGREVPKGAVAAKAIVVPRLPPVPQPTMTGDATKPGTKPGLPKQSSAF
jgi:hypothetical protein